MSYIKPALMLAAVAGWGRALTFIDKDAGYFYLKRQMWNALLWGAGLVAVALWLLIPFFWVGLFLAIPIAMGPMLGYAVYRNGEVPEDKRWRFSIMSLRGKYEEMQQDRATRRAPVTMVNSDGVNVPPPGKDDPLATAHDAFAELMQTAVSRHVERIEMAVNSQKSVTTLEVDGVKYPYQALEPAVAVSVIDYLKQFAGLDVSDRRKTQRGKVRFEGEDEVGRHQLDVSTSGSTRGLSMAMMLDAKKAEPLNLPELGMTDKQLESVANVREMVGKVAIVTGPPKSGVSTTLLALLGAHDPYTQSIVTLEEEVETELEGVTHFALDPGADGKAKSEKLAGILRRDPNVVMLSQVADVHTPKVLVAGNEHALIYFGLKLDDTTTAIKGWVRAVGDVSDAAESLGAVVSQRLVRKLCTTCRVPYQPDASSLRKLNLSPDRVGQLYKQSGKVVVKEKQETCPACGGIGYRGRVGVYEVLVFDEQARRLLSQSDLEGLRTYFSKQRVMRLDQAALAKVVDGTTSIQEVTRVLSGNKSKSAKGSKTSKSSSTSAKKTSKKPANPA